MKRLTMTAVGVVAVGLAAGAAPVAADATTVVLHRSYIHSAVRAAGVVIAPEGPSRVLTISDGTSSVMVQELVSPSIWLGVVSRPHARLRFFGGLLTGPTPPPSVVELQDRTPLGWRDMGAASVGSTGRFRYVYTAQAGLVGYAFQFRATTLATGVWQPGASKAHLAVIR